MKCDLSKYEIVKSRKEKFYKNFPDGRIIVELINPDTINSHALFKAKVYTTLEDQRNDCPRGVGYALEVRDKELLVSNDGKKYKSVNYSSWTENCEESAVGRALDNAGYSGNKKASLEEMQKADRMNTVLNTTDHEFNQSKCQKCGGEIAISLSGKPYCKNKCWLK